MVFSLSTTRARWLFIVVVFAMGFASSVNCQGSPARQAVAPVMTPGIETAPPTATGTETKIPVTSTPRVPTPQVVNVPGTGFEQSTPGGKVLVNGAWGKDPGQFGLVGSVGWGVTSFAVDANENVYVVDTGNSRIQHFSADGEYVSSFTVAPGVEDIEVASDGTIYFVDPYGQHKLLKYDQKGTLLAEFPVAPEIALPNTGSLLVQDSNVFIQALGPETDPTNSTYQIVKDGKGLSASAQLSTKAASAQTCIPGTGIVARTQDVSDEHNIIVSLNKGTTATTTIRLYSERPVAAVWGATVDKAGNLYTVLYSLQYASPERFTVIGTQITVVSYDEMGNYLGKAEMPDKRYAAVQRIVRITPDGRIYQMQATSDGAKVVRWPLAK